MAGSLAAAGYAFASGTPTGDGREVLGPGIATVTLHIEHSRFTLSPLVGAASGASSDDDRPGRSSSARIRVSQHTTVTFRIVNHDPITHEFIVGDDEVHALHASGTHGVHGAVPGEVTVEPGEMGITKYEFHSPGTVLFACHLPGHAEYGMVGDVIVLRYSATD